MHILVKVTNIHDDAMVAVMMMLTIVGESV